MKKSSRCTCVKSLLNSWSGFNWLHFNLGTMDQGTSKCDGVQLLITPTTNNSWKKSVTFSNSSICYTPKHWYLNNKTCLTSGLCMVKSYVVCMHILMLSSLFLIIYIWMCYFLDSECCWIPYFVGKVQIAKIFQFWTSFAVFWLSKKIVWAD